MGGMSGSPVFLDGSRYMTAGGRTAISSGRTFPFLGIYSGRYPSATPPDVTLEQRAHLGRVWSGECIKKVLRRNVPGSFEIRNTT